ncbi:hypothetical protein B0T22DRAFT_485100 [Podospora appendiculata]|uniref:BTB domain-containing protein n=1 Tax=Podospora appendiculata TaxID=314037 RepID=A0AAE0WZI9_9PEZI|nr:hypothetical protein B0T22DRAFT_485100 [Podospora appendiculata]
MTDSFSEDIIDDAPAGPGADVEMAEGGDDDAAAAANGAELPFAEDGPEDPYLTSPIVTLLIGTGDNETILTAHQSLLVQSPYFAEACAEFIDDGSPRQVELPNEDIDAVGCFLEFLYTGDYFPRKFPGQRSLEKDASVPDLDASGVQLLKHAKVYTLADKLGLTHLKNLASSKIHCVNSTAKGEIAYARYVYEYTPKDDTTIRAPVANFWATRSHTLRSEAADEFRSLCLEFPQFGYDVLSMCFSASIFFFLPAYLAVLYQIAGSPRLSTARVLDEKLKRERNEKMHPSPSSARKRPRHSSTAAA